MRLILLYALLVVSAESRSQQAPVSLTLQDVIKEAQNKSPRFKVAQAKREINYYQFQTFKSDFNPQVSFYGNVPVYNKEYNSVLQPDGTIKFLPIKQNFSNVGFGMSQQLPFSGGELSINTDLNNFYDFHSRFSQYRGTPVFIRLTQPLFGFNSLKWKKQIEPLKFREAGLEYVQEMESIAQEASKLYFDALDSKNNIDIAKANLDNAISNYKMEKARIDLGTTTEDRILQLEVQTLKNEQEFEKAQYDYQLAELSLKTYIGFTSVADINIAVPVEVPAMVISLPLALESGKKYRPEFVAFERMKLEARRDVQQAKASQQQVNLNASYGLNNAGSTIGAIYNDPRDQQKFSLGFNIPIMDWGRRKARYNTAKALEKLTISTSESDEVRITQEITVLVGNIALLKNNITLAHKTDSLASIRYLIANNLYKTGKLTLTDLAFAQTEKDSAKRKFISTIRDYWNSYYLLRRLTMFDFENQRPLNIERLD